MRQTKQGKKKISYTLVGQKVDFAKMKVVRTNESTGTLTVEYVKSYNPLTSHFLL